MGIVPIDIQTQSNWEIMFRGNYNRGVKVLRRCMEQSTIRDILCADEGALNCLFTAVDYDTADGRLPLAFNDYEAIIPAFNNYCGYRGIPVKSTLAETWADTTAKAAMLADDNILNALTSCSKLASVCPVPTPCYEVFGTNDYKSIALGTEIDLAVSAFTLGATSFPATTLTFQVAGINQNVDTAGKILPITMVMKHLHNGTFYMYSSNSNTFLNSTVAKLDMGSYLPADTLKYVATTRKQIATDGSTATLVNYDSKGFLLTEQEVFGTRTYSRSEEAMCYSQLQGFASGACTKVKKLNNGSGSASIWWEASPCSGSTASFCRVTGNGGAYYNDASNTYGLCFGFCYSREFLRYQG